MQAAYALEETKEKKRKVERVAPTSSDRVEDKMTHAELDMLRDRASGAVFFRELTR